MHAHTPLAPPPHMHTLTHTLIQIDPHPDFPTVVFPNPEEGKSALVSGGDLIHYTTTDQSIEVYSCACTDNFRFHNNKVQGS